MYVQSGSRRWMDGREVVGVVVLVLDWKCLCVTLPLENVNVIYLHNARPLRGMTVTHHSTLSTHLRPKVRASAARRTGTERPTCQTLEVILLCHSVAIGDDGPWI